MAANTTNGASLVRDSASTELQLFVAAEDLPKLDHFSNSDPFVIVYIKGGHDADFREIGRSEVARDTQEPRWMTAFSFHYHFEEFQELLFRVWDADGNRDTSDHHDYMGAATISVGALMGIDGGVPGRSSAELRDDGGRIRGRIKAFAEERIHSSETLIFSLAGKKLANKDGIFGRSDPYFIVHRLGEDGSWVAVHQSEVVDNNLNPRWAEQQLPLVKLGGDTSRPLRIEVWDFEKSGSHDYMGSCEIDVNTILARGQEANAGFDFPVIEEKKRAKKKSYKNSGSLAVTTARMVSVPSFVDYLMGGMEVSMMVAIDFTASNGSPQDPSSLHSMVGSDNQYADAIGAVGRVLEPYDADKQFPVYGFGARTQEGAPVSHAFRLVPSEHVSEVHGVQGILDVYRNALPGLRLSGPTVFTPIVEEAIQIATQYRVLEEAGHSLEYLTLLFITDGVINDMQNTIDAIVQASGLPMSIIIIGVGNADFSNMEVLDGDDERLENRAGVKASRDIVQFVPFRNFQSSFQRSDLARAVLAELPGQVETYFRGKGVAPRPPLYTMGSSFGGANGRADPDAPAAPSRPAAPPGPGGTTAQPPAAHRGGVGPAGPPEYSKATPSAPPLAF